MPYPVPPPEPPAIVQTQPPAEPSQDPFSQSLNRPGPGPTREVRHDTTISYTLPHPRTADIPKQSSAAELGSPVARNWSEMTANLEISVAPTSGPQGAIAAQIPAPQPFPAPDAATYSIRPDRKFQAFRPGEPVTIAQEASPEAAPEAPAIPITLPTDLVEVTAERQEFDGQRQIVTAEGDVRVRFRQTLIEADKAQVNLDTRQVAATGNVALQRGEQLVRGNRMEYNFVRNTGSIYEASGVVLTQSAGADFDVDRPAALDQSPVPLADRLTEAQPVGDVTAADGAEVEVSGLSFPQLQGDVNRLRFEAERIDIQPNGEWEATNIRITNDPFSPPELELRADTARLNRISPLQDELLTSGSRLVFDQSFSLPLFRDRTIIDRRQREPSPLEFGYDLEDLDGYFVQWNLAPISLGPVDVKFAPQALVQRAFAERLSPLDPRFYGLEAGFTGRVTPTTGVEGQIEIYNLEEFPELEEDAYRGRLRVQQLFEGYTLTGEYSYRERIFNGTLGSQTVHRSLGAVLTSPDIALGDSGAIFSFQTGFQDIEAKTDRFDLLEINRENDRIDRSRFQTVATLIYPVPLWRGEELPATASEGLRYTPRPVIPFVRFVAIVRGGASLYSQDESQFYLSGSVGFQGQLGHFSRDYLDYTGFSLFYTQVALDGQSPFLFDRLVDQRILTVGLVQQIYGGLRAGVESSFNLDNGLALNNEFTLEYSRRTYGLILRINPVRRLGSFGLRISDFNWTGDSAPFSGPDTEAED